jgi:hypothetical protein
MLLFAITIFLSAFLLFQVQPLIARAILPWFGGGAGVWAACLVFFQATLLLGYVYAHGIVSRITPPRQRMVHVALLALCLLFLPIGPSASWKPIGAGDPTWRILGLLAATIGLPYFVLSTTGPLFQAWFAQAHRGASPYRLFALSNGGSLLGLLSYPLLVEPNLTLKAQYLGWSAGFCAFALAAGFTAWHTRHAAAVADPAMLPVLADAPPPKGPSVMFWILLAACPSLLLIGVTNHLTQAVAAVPLIWVLPLSLYLLSLTFCFGGGGGYYRAAFLALAVPALGGMSFLIWNEAPQTLQVKYLIAMFAAGFFIVCIVCHGELARLKPHPRFLTQYFLSLSLGGALGGVFAALLAPAVFDACYEIPIGIALCALLIVGVFVRERETMLVDGLFGWRAIALFLAATFLLGFLGRVVHDSVRDSLVVARNFYGELRVRQYNGVYTWQGHRTLVHGNINHGEQMTHPARRREPTTYYCAASGVGLVMRARVVGNPQRVGIIGLGTGTLSVYARPGDAYRFYDINPLIQRIANSQFTFLNDAEAQVEVVLGDARLSLEREPDQRFQILLVDAFSGDSIPVHLLTLEAIRLYFRHLDQEGVLAFHVSNKFLDLAPIVLAAARDLHKEARVVDTVDAAQSECFGATWVILTARKALFERPEFLDSRYQQVAPAERPWTDDYSSLLRLLK